VSSTLTDVAEAFNLNDAGMMSGLGPQARRRQGVSPQRKAAQESAFRLLTAAWDGNRQASLTATEAFSTSDLFRSAAGDILDRVLLAQYDATPTQWQTIATRTTVRNFRKKYLYELMGSRTVLERVPELTEYPSADYTLAERSISVAKFGRRFGWSFEAAINDDIGELEQVPGQFAVAARKTEDFEALKQLCNTATGAPNTAFFNATNGNLGTGALTYDNLTTVLSNRLATRRDAEGNLLARPGMRLVVGPALEFQAQRVLNVNIIRTNTAAGQIEEPNALRGSVSLQVNAFLPGTAWYLIPDPASPRPAFYIAFLTGWETPDLRYKNDQGQRAGGGAVAPEEGSFDDDSVYYRVRHITGAATGDPTFTYASDGLGA
jgi:hypothetical protein